MPPFEREVKKSVEKWHIKIFIFIVLIDLAWRFIYNSLVHNKIGGYFSE
jgi:hypothetical protein